MNEPAFFALLLFVGGASALTDWRERRIPNRLIVLGLLSAGAALAVQLLSSAMGHRHLRWHELGEFYMPWRWFPMIGAHFALSAVAGWTLWRLDIWPAGDAKLYIVLSLLLPFVDTTLSGFPLLLFMVFLVNIFVPAGLIFAAEGLTGMALAVPAALSAGPFVALKAAGDAVRVRLREIAALRWQAAAVFVNLAALFFVMRLAQSRLQERQFGPFGSLVIFLVMFVAWSRLSPVLKRPRVGAASLVLFCVSAWAAVASGADLGGLLWRTAKSMVNFGLFLSVARMAFDRYLEQASLASLQPEELRTGTILTEDAWQALLRDPQSAALLAERRCDGLSAEEAEGLRARLRRPGAAALMTCRAVPFAAWILLGALLTLWKPGTVVSWLLSWAGRLS